MNKQTRKAIAHDIREKLSYEQLFAKWGSETLNEFSDEVKNITRAMRGRAKVLSCERKKLEEDLRIERIYAALKVCTKLDNGETLILQGRSQH